LAPGCWPPLSRIMSSTSEPQPEADDSLPLFVYGTLRKGGENHSLLRGRTVYEMCATLAGATLMALPRYPMLIDGAAVVQGELMILHPRFYSDVLAKLDYFEGYRPGDDTSLYFRVERTVTSEGGSLRRAWVYMGNPRWLDPSASVIPHGDWIRYRAEMVREKR